jgi:hypothetical protein
MKEHFAVRVVRLEARREVLVGQDGILKLSIQEVLILPIPDHAAIS